MPASQIALIALLAEAAAHPVYGPTAPPKPQPKVVAAAPAAGDNCDRRPKSDREIVVCAPRSEGYRLNPDVIEAKREAKNQGNPPKSRETYKDANACASVGPFGCTGTPAINLIAVGLVAAQMARRALTGGNVGEMFVDASAEDRIRTLHRGQEAPRGRGEGRRRRPARPGRARRSRQSRP